ncbi:hypothetical protein QNH48_14375 [Neobacillus sp. YX16]|uniref:hypothetical protein n=1 Tax=Neobacillus sp. YX16 TaxID=3047874 RepID=UPI0024C4232E|nr:hypothetical protein [Neobacillus sp. YX16]WHZ05734.1 hypothetical protein QNH48_14375 [Neobacillus sp. YX16]
MYYHQNEIYPVSVQLIQMYVGNTIRTHIMGYGNVVAYVLSIDPRSGMVGLIVFLSPFGYQRYIQVHFSNIAGISQYFERSCCRRDIIISTDETWSGAKAITPHEFWYKPTHGKWVWSTDSESETATISKTFPIENLATVEKATLYFGVDNYGSVKINDNEVIKYEKTTDMSKFTKLAEIDIHRFLKQGNNTITIQGSNTGSYSSANPGGIYAMITIQTSS